MIRHDTSASPKPGLSEGLRPGVLVMICDALRSLGNGPDLADVANFIEETKQGTRVVVVPDLCHKPRAIADHAASDTGCVVLGLCSNDYSEPEFQRRARKTGIDPLAITPVNLGSYCACCLPRQAATVKAKVLLAAATARAQSFPGSTPDNIRPYVIGDGQKISRRALFTLPPIAYRPVVSIDGEKCAANRGCQDCVQVCPENALTSVDGRIEVARRSCASCGICQAVCPTSAATLPAQSHQQIEAEITELLRNPVLDESVPRAILFVCQRSAQAVDSLAEAALPPAAHWLPVTVPCSGFVTPAMLLQCLAQGAKSVGIIGCADSCRFGQEDLTKGKVDYCQQVLSLLGRSPEAVQFLDASLPLRELAEALNRPLPASAHEPLGEPVSLSFAGPRAVVQALISLAPATDPHRFLDVTHPSSPLGLTTIDASGCTGCGSCAQVCPTDALRLSEREGTVALSYDPTLCTGCSQCVDVCPEDVVRVDRSTNLARLREGRTNVYEDDTIRCQSCDAPVGPRAMLQRIESLLSADENGTSEATMTTITKLCPDCRAKGVRLAR